MAGKSPWLGQDPLIKIQGLCEQMRKAQRHRYDQIAIHSVAPGASRNRCSTQECFTAPVIETVKTGGSSTYATAVHVIWVY